MLAYVNTDTLTRYLQTLLACANKYSMANITSEILDFLNKTGCSQRRLALESGVPASTICNLIKRKRFNLYGSSQDRLRVAMLRIAKEHGVTLDLGPLGDCDAQKG